MATRDSATESAFIALASDLPQTEYLATAAKTVGIPPAAPGYGRGSGWPVAAKPDRSIASCLWVDNGFLGIAPIMYAVIVRRRSRL